MEQCRVNAFNLVPFQLISLALHVLHDGINSSLCRWTEDSLPFPCSKGSKAVGALSHGWKTRREESSFFSDKHGKLSNWALHKLLRHEEKCRTAEAVSVTQIHSGHGLPELLKQDKSTGSQVPEAASSGLWRDSMWVKGSHGASHGRGGRCRLTLCNISLPQVTTKALQFAFSIRWMHRELWKTFSKEMGTILGDGAWKMKGTDMH